VNGNLLGEKRIGQVNNGYVANNKWPTGTLEHEGAR
jgi:hypothetical protein